jgi:hypothetical protein
MQIKKKRWKEEAGKKRLAVGARIDKALFNRENVFC